MPQTGCGSRKLWRCYGGEARRGQVGGSGSLFGLEYGLSQCLGEHGTDAKIEPQ